MPHEGDSRTLAPHARSMGPLPEEIAQCCGDHYLLEGEAGRGGMGVVYRAWDQRLDRRVAIKTLRSSGQDGPEDVQRFRREAKTVASLQHPNIASIHTLEEPRPGLLLLVMEWVEGRTLAEHIAAGPPPVDRTIAWFSRIAAALECTHERRVIHRDLKPANVMLTAEGTIKVLDFGLARQAVAAPTQDTAEASTGLVGTPRYMSPEQIEEKPLDSRTDVFSFGSMLYECLAGRPAFDGTTAIELFGGILYREPDWNVLPSGISAPLRRLLEECLHKDRDRRVQDMSTIRGVLEHLMTGAIEPAVAIPPPAPITTFVGRAAELAECRERLPRHRLFTLTGPGGCGKTRLALELARDATSRQVDVVAFADLAPVQDPERVPPAIAAALGIGEDRERDLGMRAAKTLATRSGLLIVDNCEHVIASCAQAVTALLEACPTLSVLATSREPLGITGEQTFPLGSLSLPSGNPEDLAAVADSDAVQLFEERARQVSAGFAMNPGNVGFVVQICRELDGIPLAIELAAARIRVLEPKDVAARLRDRFRLLTGGSRSALPRHRTLWATLQWSYDLLTPTEQLALRAASAFVGAWPFEGLAALLEGVDEFELLDTLTHLVQKSLVTRVAGVDEVRYRLLETTRHFARAHLEQTGERDATMARHAVYVLDLVERAEPELWGVRQSTWLARLETDHEDVMAAIGWCARDGDAAELGLRMAVALRRFWNIRGYIDVGRQALTAALEHTSVEPRPLRGRALDGLANLSLLRGEYASAEEDFERSLAVHRELGDAQGMARAWTGLGHVAVHTGRHERARTCYGESLERCRAIGDRQGVAAGLGNLAGIALVRGEFAAARPLMEQAVELFQEVGNDHSVAIGLHELALIDMKLGEPCAALAHLGRCFEIVQALSAPRATAGALEITAELATALGAAVDAATFFGAAAALRRMAGARLGPEEAQQQDEVIADARRAIDADRFERAWSAGAALSLEEAVLAASRWTRARLEEPPPRSTSG